jgi:hypothetical protein
MRNFPGTEAWTAPLKRFDLIISVLTLLVGLTCYSNAQGAAAIAQQAYLKASNTDAGDGFASVAISVDTLVVGAAGESSNARNVNGNQSDNSAPNSGAAYVFLRSGTNWVQQAYLKASNAEANDEFGDRVAMSGDTIVVSAGGESSSATGVNGNQSNNNATSSGAAYVFVRSGASWEQQAYLKASNTRAFAYFGTPAISGDTVVIGAWGDSSSVTGVNGNPTSYNANAAGAAYVFVRNGTNWSQQAFLKASNTGAIDNFGDSVAVDGDTIVVGAPQEESNATGVNGNQSDNSAPNAGAAYVFVRNGTNWTQQAYLKASNTGAGDQFGVSVTVSGDTIVIGAGLESSSATGVNGNENDNSAPRSGAAYVFVRNGTNWVQQAYLKPSDTAPDHYFGSSVAISGNTLLVGADANSDGNGIADSGTAYVFARSGTNWTQQASLKASNARPSDFFGGLLAFSGDTAAVGAPGEASNATGVNGNQSDSSAPGSGAVYVFTGLGPSARTITVTNTADSGTGTLRAALASAAKGDTINFSLPTPARIALTGGELLVSTSVIIAGPGANNLVVDGNATNRVFHVGSNTVVNISGLTIANGYVRYFMNGGGILNDHADLTVNNCTLSHNHAGKGGAIMNDQGSLVVANTILSYNWAGDLGGAIYNDGQFATNARVIVSHSTLNDNSGFLSGSAIFNDAGSRTASVRIVHSTVSGNVAGECCSYSDIGNQSWSSGSATVQIFNSTLKLSIGIYSSSSGGSASVEIGSTILNGPSFTEGVQRLPPSVVSLGYNLSSDGGGGFLTNATDQINTDPMLGPLQDNGGPNFTHAPLPGSPVIDKGKSFSASATDQRGFARTIDYVIPNASGGDGTDIGAVEMAAIPFLCNFGIVSNEFGFNVIGISNQIAIVESSTNFANWTPQRTNTFGAAPFYFTDPVPANVSRRFYRARSP